MRFARLRKNADDQNPAKPDFLRQTIMVIYNLVWWLPLALVLIGTIDDFAGFASFTVITLARAIANWYRNNAPLTLEQAEVFPLRTP